MQSTFKFPWSWQNIRAVDLGESLRSTLPVRTSKDSPLSICPVYLFSKDSLSPAIPRALHLCLQGLPISPVLPQGFSLLLSSRDSLPYLLRLAPFYQSPRAFRFAPLTKNPIHLPISKNPFLSIHNDIPFNCSFLNPEICPLPIVAQGRKSSYISPSTLFQPRIVLYCIWHGKTQP